MKLSEKQKARELRHQGWSIIAIAKHLGVSKGSVFLWVQDIELTPEQQEQLKANSRTMGNFEKARLTRLAKEEAKREVMRQEARRLYERFKHDPFFMAGLASYWAERDRASSCL